jgi:hypothetical protein
MTTAAWLSIPILVLFLLLLASLVLVAALLEDE